MAANERDWMKRSTACAGDHRDTELHQYNPPADEVSTELPKSMFRTDKKAEPKRDEPSLWASIWTLFTKEDD